MMYNIDLSFSKYKNHTIEWSICIVEEMCWCYSLAYFFWKSTIEYVEIHMQFHRFNGGFTHLLFCIRDVEKK
jgi:hypothetical protein